MNTILPNEQLSSTRTVADPGFPVGGRRPHRGGIDSRGGYVSKILYVETICPAHAPLDPPMKKIENGKIMN